MIVCVCHRVSDRDIAQAVSQGCPSFEALQSVLAVSTACGRCRDCARDTYERCAAGTGPVQAGGIARQTLGSPAERNNAIRLPLRRLSAGGVAPRGYENACGADTV